MLRPNNPFIDSAQLAEKADYIATYRRLSEQLMMHASGTKQAASIHLSSPTHWRSRLKAIPLLGPMLRKIYWLWLTFSAPGLGWRVRIRLLPGVGPLAYWSYSLIKLGSFSAHTKGELAHLHHLIGLQQQQVELLQQRLELSKTENQARRESLQIHLEQQINKLEQQEKNLGNQLSDMTRALRNLERAPDRAPPATPAAENGNNLPARVAYSHMALRSFYLAFENRFRGEYSNIQSRLRAYLPYLKKIHLVRNELQVLDVGCGRGEWLELLKEAGYQARGIDLDAEMVQYAHERGLSVEQGDAIAYLSNLPTESLDVVSAFHVIEHLPLERLVILLDEILRVLRPTGMAIFETPNPENLQVGACNFYYDPTHLHPIPPAVAEFMASQRGFATTSILRLHPYPEQCRVAEESELGRRFNDMMYGPQDYALLAGKHHHEYWAHHED